MREQDAAGHGADDGFDVRVLELLCHRFAELLRIPRMLQDIEFLDVVRAVEARGQQEMAIHDGVGLDEEVFDLLFGHGHLFHTLHFFQDGKGRGFRIFGCPDGAADDEMGCAVLEGLRRRCDAALVVDAGT